MCASKRILGAPLVYAAPRYGGLDQAVHDADVREMMAQLLTLEGFNARTVANGKEALDYLRTGDRPDVILLDLMMPVMDGRTFCEHQRNDPRLAHLPVVVMTAGRDLDRCPVPASEVLHKPVPIDVLLLAVERATAG